MSDIAKQWYKEYKKRYDENIHLWNTNKEECSEKITGYSLSHNAWRMLKISGAVSRMGGFANFSHYVNKCAETDYQCFDEKVQKDNEELQKERDYHRGNAEKLAKVVAFYGSHDCFVPRTPSKSDWCCANDLEYIEQENGRHFEMGGKLAREIKEELPEYFEKENTDEKTN